MEPHAMKVTVDSLEREGGGEREAGLSELCQLEGRGRFHNSTCI